jgi:hypothetical protein
MTFDDDFVQFNFQGGTKRFTCKELGVDWPPPESIEFCGFVMTRNRYSQISDEDRSAMTNVIRGAEYLPEGQS